jgi:MoxR-like ATPase
MEENQQPENIPNIQNEPASNDNVNFESRIDLAPLLAHINDIRQQIETVIVVSTRWSIKCSWRFWPTATYC